MSGLLESMYKCFSQNVCRCCGEKANESVLQQLFPKTEAKILNLNQFNNKLENENYQKQDSFGITDVLKEFEIWHLQIAKNDGLPQQICSKCFQQFQFIHLFRHKCLEIQSKLLAIYLKSDSELKISNEKLPITSESAMKNLTTSDTVINLISTNPIDGRKSCTLERSTLLPWCYVVNTVTKDNKTLWNFNGDSLQSLEPTSNDKIISLSSHSTNSSENVLLTKAAVKEYTIFQSKMEDVTTQHTTQQYDYKGLNLNKNKKYTCRKRKLNCSIKNAGKKVLAKSLKIARKQFKVRNKSLNVTYESGMKNIANNVHHQFKWRSNVSQNSYHLKNNKKVVKGYEQFRKKQLIKNVLRNNEILSPTLTSKIGTLSLAFMENIPERNTTDYCLENNKETLVDKSKPLKKDVNNYEELNSNCWSSDQQTIQPNNIHLINDLNKSIKIYYEKNEEDLDVVSKLTLFSSKDKNTYKPAIFQEWSTFSVNKTEAETILSNDENSFNTVKPQNINESKLLLASKASLEVAPNESANDKIVENIDLITKEKIHKSLNNQCKEYTLTVASSTDQNQNQNSSVEFIQENLINYNLEQNQSEGIHWPRDNKVLPLSPRAYLKFQQLKTSDTKTLFEEQETKKYHKNNQENVINNFENEQIYRDNKLLQITNTRHFSPQISQYSINNKNNVNKEENKYKQTNKVRDNSSDFKDYKQNDDRHLKNSDYLQKKKFKKPCLKRKWRYPNRKLCLLRPKLKSLQNKIELEMITKSLHSTMNINSQLQTRSNKKQNDDLNRKDKNNSPEVNDKFALKINKPIISKLYGENIWETQLKESNKNDSELKKDQTIKMPEREEAEFSEVESYSKVVKTQGENNIKEVNEEKNKIYSEKESEMLKTIQIENMTEFEIPKPTDLMERKLLRLENSYETQETLNDVNVKSSQTPNKISDELQSQAEFKYDFCSSQRVIKDQSQSKPMLKNSSLNNEMFSEIIEDDEIYQNVSNKCDINDRTIQTTSNIHGTMTMNACKTVNNMSNYDVITAAARPSQGLVATLNSIADVSYHQSESTSTNKEPIRTKTNNPYEIIDKEQHSCRKFSDNEQPDEACATIQSNNTFSNNNYSNCWDFIGCSIESDTNRQDSKNVFENNSNNAIIVTTHVNTNTQLPQHKNSEIVDLEYKQSFEYIDKELNKFIDIVAENTCLLNKTLTYDSVQVITTVSQLASSETPLENFCNFYTSGQSKENTECTETTPSSLLPQISPTTLPSTGLSSSLSSFSSETPLSSLPASPSSTILFNNELFEVEDALNGILNEMQDQSASKDVEETTINSISNHENDYCNSDPCHQADNCKNVSELALDVPREQSGNHYDFNQDQETATNYFVSSYNDNNVSLQSANFDYQNSSLYFENIKPKSTNDCNHQKYMNNSNYSNNMNPSALLNYHHSMSKSDFHQNQHQNLQSTIATENNYITNKNQEQHTSYLSSALYSPMVSTLKQVSLTTFASENVSGKVENSSIFSGQNPASQNNDKQCSESNKIPNILTKTQDDFQNTQNRSYISNKVFQKDQNSPILHLSNTSLPNFPQDINQMKTSIRTSNNNLLYPELVKLPDNKSIGIYNVTPTTLNFNNNSHNHVSLKDTKTSMATTNLDKVHFTSNILPGNAISVAPSSTIPLSLTNGSALPAKYYETSNLNSILLNGSVIPYGTTLTTQPSISKSINVANINHKDYGNYLSTTTAPASLSSVKNNNLLAPQYMVISPTSTYDSHPLLLTSLIASPVIFKRDETYNNQTTAIPMANTFPTQISLPSNVSEKCYDNNINKINSCDSINRRIKSNNSNIHNNYDNDNKNGNKSKDNSNSNDSNDSINPRQAKGNKPIFPEIAQNQLKNQNTSKSRQLKFIQPRVEIGQTKQEVNLTCRFCHKRRNFTNNINYSNHIIAEHPACHPFNCPYCPMYFQRRVHRQKHISLRHTEQKFECPQCNTNFETQRTLDKHLQRYHKIATNNININSQNNDCNWSCGTPSPEQIEPDSTSCLTLKDNQIQIASNQAITAEQILGENYYNVKGKLSEEKVSSLSNVIERTLATHYYHCPICERGFRLRSGLKRHMVVHDATGRPFECSECPKRFPSYFHLKFHKFTVHKITQAATEKDLSAQD